MRHKNIPRTSGGCRPRNTSRLSRREPMAAGGYAAMVAGAVFAIIVGVGLMALLFYSSRKGYDEPPHFHADDD